MPDENKGKKLDEAQKKALAAWYARNEVLEEVGRLRDGALWEELEEYIHMGALMPVGRSDTLPGFMKNKEGRTLFPDNLNPRSNLEGWRDAIEVGWAVVEEKLGLTRDEVHIRIRDAQNEDWERFLKRE